MLERNLKEAYTFKNSWEFLVIGIIVILYGVLAFFFYKKRKGVSFMTRSPISISISIASLGIDSVINTLIFGKFKIG